MIYSVIDTNVIVSALISKNSNSPPVKVVAEALNGKIIPLYRKNIIDEYIEVLKRPKFHLEEKTVDIMVNSIIYNGLEVLPVSTGAILPDQDDLIFYEVAMAERKNNSYLVTGNLKHFPDENFIVSPAEMVDILNK